MEFAVLWGRAKPVKAELFGRIRRAHEAGDANLIALVPAQFTLSAEMMILGAPDAEGSFRLNVLSPERLHRRIFEQAGFPKGTRIDAQGRVMLVHRAAKRRGAELRWYASAVNRPSFAEKALLQIEAFKQAGIGPDRLLSIIDPMPECALRSKLTDLLMLYTDYEEALAGRFLDGEDEARAAIARMKDAPMLEGAEVFVYGFDLISTSLAHTLIALSRQVKRLTLALAIDETGGDADLFAPVKRSYDRLERIAQAQGVPLCVQRAQDGGEEGAIQWLSMALGAVPERAYAKEPQGVELLLLKNPQDEAEHAAALVRRLVMDNGWRWRDIALCCQQLDGAYESALRRAFALYDVPLFLPSSRPADRHPAARCLLSALRLLTHGWRSEDMVDYIRAGFTDLTDAQADRLVNHILERGLRGSQLKRELRWLAESDADLQGFREIATAPLLELERATSGQTDARGVLGAVFAFLERLEVCTKIEEQQRLLLSLEARDGQPLREWAMEGAQVWNRILLSLDQMHELFSDGELPLRMAGELLQRSLQVAEIRPLPQSGDAVLCGSVDHMKSKQVKALLVVGMSAMSVPADSSLLSDRELSELSSEERLSAQLAPADRQRMALLMLKGAMAFTSDYLMLCCPSSDAKGAALRPGAQIQQIERILKRRLNSPEPGQELALRLNAEQAARCRVGALSVGEGEHLPILRAARRALGPARPSFAARGMETLPGALRERLLPDDRISVSQLENYAQCPYKHFAERALHPQRFEEFSLTPLDEGIFYHEAMERFLSQNRAELPQLPPEESMRRMDALADRLIEEQGERLLGPDAAGQLQKDELKGVARRAASTLVRQMRGSAFFPEAMELAFGEGMEGVQLSSGARLEGKIDRVDALRLGEEQYLRVIDYKTGGRGFDMAKLYYGLQMQLMIYLAAAAKQQGGKPAGAFYFTLSDKPVDTDARDAGQVEAERMKAQKLSGPVLSEAGVLSAMAENPKDVMKLSKNSQFSQAELSLLINHALDKAGQTHRRMMGGEIAPNPYEMGGKTACEYCDYKALCLNELHPKTNALRGLKGPEALEKMREDAGP